MDSVWSLSNSFWIGLVAAAAAAEVSDRIRVRRFRRAMDAEIDALLGRAPV